MKKTEVYGSAPIYFTNSDEQKEWDDLPECHKSFLMNNLHETTSKLTIEMALKTLCHVINDMHARLEKIEKQKD